MGKFVVSTRKDGEFQFVLQAANGQVILTSEGYSSKAACLDGIASVKQNAPIPDRYLRKNTPNGKFHFTLTSPNGQVIGSSQIYESQSGMENGISSVRINAPEAPIEEATSVK
jgi:uncharacterized protein YegP (UPF0339 family)